MSATGSGSRWISRTYLGVAGAALVSIALAAWWTSNRAPHRQANRIGDIQLRMLRQARDRMVADVSSIERTIRDVASLPTVIDGTADPGIVAAQVARGFAGLEVEGAHLVRLSEEGNTTFEIRPSLLADDNRLPKTAEDLKELLDWARRPENRGQADVDLERVTNRHPNSRLWIRYVASVWRPGNEGSAPEPAGILLFRIPISSFLTPYLLQAHPLNESYTFVIEVQHARDTDEPPIEIIWHEREPRWMESYSIDTEAFVRAFVDLSDPSQREGFRIIDVPQSDGGVRREIVSSLVFTLGSRRWITGMSTPYEVAVLPTPGQQGLLAGLGGLTLAVLAAGGVLLHYQQSRLRTEATEAQRAHLERIQHNYQELFALNPTAMLVFDIDGRLADCNHSAERLMGLSGREAKGKKIGELFEPDSIERLWERLSRHEQLSQMDARLVRRLDQKSTLVEAWGRRIGDHLILMAHDVEQRRDLDRQVARLRRMESVGSLASTLAHDFNNLLGQVQILVSNLRSDLPAQSNLHDDLTTIEEKIEDASHLVSNLLSSRENVIADEPVYIEPILREFASGLRKLIPERVELVSDVRPDLPSVWITPHSLRRLLDNLCLNAIDAMPYGGTLTLRARGKWIEPQEATDQLRSDHYCVVEIVDTGVGMSQQTLDSIFEPFFTTKAEGKGTGLGLWTIYKIMRRLRGAIHVNSAPGQGTRFTLYLAHTRPSEDIDSPGLELARPNR